MVIGNFHAHSVHLSARLLAEPGQASNARVDPSSSLPSANFLPSMRIGNETIRRTVNNFAWLLIIPHGIGNFHAHPVHLSARLLAELGQAGNIQVDPCKF